MTTVDVRTGPTAPFSLITEELELHDPQRLGALNDMVRTVAAFVSSRAISKSQQIGFLLLAGWSIEAIRSGIDQRREMLWCARCTLRITDPENLFMDGPPLCARCGVHS